MSVECQKIGSLAIYFIGIPNMEKDLEEGLERL
jgi:hypothetical protein